MLTRRQVLRHVSCGTMLLVAGCVAPDSPWLTATPSSSPAELPATETPIPTSSQQQETASADMDLNIMIGQMFMVGFRGLTVDKDHPIVRDIQQRHLGSVVLFDYDVPNGEFVRNIESPEQVKVLNEALQAAAQVPLLIATDQEGGLVARLSERFGFPATLSAQALGEIDDVQQTFDHARQMARTLKSVGINQNLAPVVDVNVNPESPAIGAYERSFSADPQKVIEQASAFIRAHHEENILTTLKHFPGHGSARDDSHRGFVDVTETWSPIELKPYAALIAEGLADAIMTAHIFNKKWDDTDPATLSTAVITDILRKELGYDGVVISDDLQMGAIREFYTFEAAIQKSLEAGVDILAIANNSVYEEDVMQRGVAVVQGLVSTGAITRDRIERSYQRIQALKSRLL